MARHLALKIACSNQKDRQWILSHLSEEEQDFLQPILAEIEDLQLSKDPSVVASLLESIDLNTSTVVKQSMPSGIEDINLKAIFWQRMLLGCIANSEIDHVLRKYEISIDKSAIIDNIPSSLRSSLLRNLRTK